LLPSASSIGSPPITRLASLKPFPGLDSNLAFIFVPGDSCDVRGSGCTGGRRGIGHDSTMADSPVIYFTFL
jgi:hypothetical protein